MRPHQRTAMEMTSLVLSLRKRSRMASQILRMSSSTKRDNMASCWRGSAAGSESVVQGDIRGPRPWQRARPAGPGAGESNRRLSFRCGACK